MFVSSLIHEITLKNVLFQKKTVLRENHLNRESKSRVSQFIYTCAVNMNLLSIVTPWSIYHNLLVEADVFAILGVSFCVMQNTFIFIGIKNKNIGAQFRNYYIPLCRPFLNDGVVGFVCVAQTFPHCNVSIVVFMNTG